MPDPTPSPNPAPTSVPDAPEFDSIPDNHSRVVAIDNVGNVVFPDHMDDEAVHAASAELHAQANPVPEPDDYSVTGATPEQEKQVRGWIADAAPEVKPNTIVYLPSKQYNKVRSQLENGFLGDQRVGSTSGQGGSESFGRSGSVVNTHIGDGFSLRSAKRIYLNADTLKNDKRARDVLYHELGHLKANTASEEVADEGKDTFNKREKNVQQITSMVDQLPLRKSPSI
jgi:hypothetical protein